MNTGATFKRKTQKGNKSLKGGRKDGLNSMNSHSVEQTLTSTAGSMLLMKGGTSKTTI